MVALEPSTTPYATRPAAIQEEGQSTAEVILYCTPWCPDCRRARTYLKERGIQYREIDITRDGEAAKQVRGWAGGYETTPTFSIQGTVIVNYSKEKLDATFAALRQPARE